MGILPACTSVHYSDALCPQRLEGGIRGSRTTMTDGCKLRGDAEDWSQVLWKSSQLPSLLFVCWLVGIWGEYEVPDSFFILPELLLPLRVSTLMQF